MLGPSQKSYHASNPGTGTVSWESHEQRPLTGPDEPNASSRRAPAPPPARPFGGPPLHGTPGAVILAAFVLILISGVLGLVSGVQRVDDTRAGDGELTAVVVIVGGVVCLAAAFLTWQGRPEFGGILAIICGVIFLVLGPDTAGLLGVLGGILALVSRRVPELTV